MYLHGVGRASSPGIQHLRPVTLEHRFLIPSLLVQAYQHLPLVSHHDVYQPFTSVDHTMPSSLPTPLMLGVVTSAHAPVTIPKDEATLSQQLRTPPLPVTHVLVGYWWQNTRLCPVYTVITATQTTSCRTSRILATPTIAKPTSFNSYKNECRYVQPRL